MAYVDSARFLRRPLALALLLLIMAALLLTGCSLPGSGEAEYEQEMKLVQSDITKASQAVSQMEPTASASDRAKIINEQAEAFEAAADRADKLTPPSKGKAAHDKLVKALNDYVGVLEKLSVATANDDSDSYTTLLGESGPIVDDLQDASRELKEAGIDFTPGAE